VKIVITGGHGLVGRHVARRGAGAGHEMFALGRAELDICDEDSIARALDAHAPTVVIHAAAMADVDRSEREPELAFAVNARGSGNVAEACARRGIAMLALSTDFVFPGTAAAPYREDDARAPVNVYGASKLAGEDGVLAANGTVVRTAWVFAPDGQGFANVVLRAAHAGTPLRVVADQHGTPTWADDLADALLALAEIGVRAKRPFSGGAPDAELQERSGPHVSARVFHVANVGAVSRYELACAIVEAARRAGAPGCEVEPITSEHTPGRAPRPGYSVLEISRIRDLGIVMPDWRSHLDALVGA